MPKIDRGSEKETETGETSLTDRRPFDVSRERTAESAPETLERLADFLTGESDGGVN